MKLLFKTKVPGHYDRVFSQFDRKLFEALKPPLLSLNIEKFDGSAVGNEVHLKVGLGPFGSRWVSVITREEKNEKENFFVDEGKLLPWPLKSWCHYHRVQKVSETESLIVDEIEYATSNGVLDRLIYPALYAQFALRGPAYRRFFRCQETYASKS